MSVTGGPIVGDARAGERHVVELLARRFGVDDPVVLRLARLTVRAAAAGHSCLDLALLDAELVASLDARRLARDVVGARDDRADDDGPLPGLEVALTALRECAAVHVVAALPEEADGAEDGGGIRIVGPRPHAVAHNETYRRLIGPYMVRHKVKPGITGWAQIHGHRGETDTLEKMRDRVAHDLEYLRHWSLGLDLRIVVRTALLMLADRQAY